MDQMIGKALNFGNQNKNGPSSSKPSQQKPFGKRLAGQLLGGKPPIQPRGRGAFLGGDEGGGAQGLVAAAVGSAATS